MTNIKIDFQNNRNTPRSKQFKIQTNKSTLALDFTKWQTLHRRQTTITANWHIIAHIVTSNIENIVTSNNRHGFNGHSNESITTLAKKCSMANYKKNVNWNSACEMLETKIVPKPKTIRLTHSISTWSENSNSFNLIIDTTCK